MYVLKAISLFILLFAGFSCKQTPLRPAGEENLRVLTTVGMLTDIVERIGEGVVVVDGLIGEGVDPHLFTPSASDVRRIQSADVVLYVGHHLEGRLQRTLERRKQQGHRVLAVAEQLDAERLMADEDGEVDPHLWMDVTLWGEVARVVCEQLSSWLPEHRETLETNLAGLLEEMASLHLEVRDLLAVIPAERRILITAHDAFGYLGRRYDIEVLGIQGFSTESEAGLRRIHELVDLIVAKKIPAVFIESTLADKQVMALVEGAASRGHPLRIGGELYSDAMGAPGTEEGTYFGMIRHNARTIADALAGEIVP